MSLFIAAIIPVAVFLYLIYRKDTKKEPIKLLVKCFLWGIVSAVPAVCLALILESDYSYENSLVDAFNQAFLGAAIPEELMKFILLYYLIWKSLDFDQHYDGIIYAVFISLGFAAIENVMYVMDEDGGYEVALMRAFLSVPGHGFWGVIMGYFFSMAKFSQGAKRMRNLANSLFVPILLHGIFNSLLFYASGEDVSEFAAVLTMLIFVVFVIYFWRLGIRKIKKQIEKDIQKIEEEKSEIQELDPE